MGGCVGKPPLSPPCLPRDSFFDGPRDAGGSCRNGAYESAARHRLNSAGAAAAAPAGIIVAPPPLERKSSGGVQRHSESAQLPPSQKQPWAQPSAACADPPLPGADDHAGRRSEEGASGFLPGSPPDSSEWQVNEPLDLSVITGRTAIPTPPRSGTASNRGGGGGGGGRAGGSAAPGARHSGESRTAHLVTVPTHIAGQAVPLLSRFDGDESRDGSRQSQASRAGSSSLCRPTTGGSVGGTAATNPPLYARMAGSMHGAGVLSGGGIVGGGGSSGYGSGGGDSMCGGVVVGMGSSSMHAGAMSGGGSGHGSTVALRAAQAAKLRASRTAQERHNVRIVGSGPDLLVLSHGFGFNQAMWAHVLESFDTALYRIVLYDLTGAVGSDADAFDFQRYSTLHGFAEDLLQLLTEMGVEGDWGQQCTLVGHGQSGMIALLAAIERPKLFKRIVLLASSPRLLEAPPEYESSFGLADLDKVFGIMQGNFRLWAKGCAPVLNADDVKAAHVREFTRPLFSLRPDVAFSCLKTSFACDLREVLPQVEVPVHMLFLEGDPTTPPAVAAYMLRHMPGATAEVLPARSVHQQPDAVADGILRLLQAAPENSSGSQVIGGGVELASPPFDAWSTPMEVDII
ncbi:hypothetical protein CLOP_g20719 [Closterium sp. NIES-67]|nr:hypothetical protein CLOP_g20719 [Closterium sp. NIES-67]